MDNLSDVQKKIVEDEEFLIDIARVDFATFIKLVFPEYEFDWFSDVMIEEATLLVFSDEYHNLVASSPPRSGKSILFAILFPCWMLGVMSERTINGGDHPYEIMVGGYTNTLTREFSSAVQTYMKKPIYGKIFPNVHVAVKGGKYGSQYFSGVNSFDIIVDVKDTLDNKNMENSKSTSSTSYLKEDKALIYKKSGTYRAVCPGSTVTGRGASLMVLDDMVKSQREAELPSQRKFTEDWYRTAFSTRKQSFGNLKAKTIVVMTRWHPNDIIGTILEEDDNREVKEWRRVILPAEAYPEGDSRRHPKDTRKEGEKLTHRIDFEEPKKTLSKSQYSSLYQQDPVSTGGNIIPIEDIKYYKKGDDLPGFDTIFACADLSFDALEKGSFCVFQKWGVVYEPELKCYLLHQTRGKMDYVKQREVLTDYVNNHKDISGHIYLEKAANASALGSEFGATNKKLRSHDTYDSLGSIPFVTLRVVRDAKQIRVMNVLFLFERGHVYIPEDEDWTHDYIKEMKSFPIVLNDDQVDCTSLALGVIAEGYQNIKSFMNLNN